MIVAWAFIWVVRLQNISFKNMFYDGNLNLKLNSPLVMYLPGKGQKALMLMDATAAANLVAVHESII